MLYIVATPIGNLSDITERAKEILTTVSYVACEDTRHSRILMDKIGGKAQLVALHAHSSDREIDRLISLLQQGVDVALITDAGTPGISDPGGLLVERAHLASIPVSPIPGASSVAAALSVCGFPADQFIFYGFLPKKKGRHTLLQSLITQKMTTVFFESPERIQRTLQDFGSILEGERRICICRELTKHYEEVWVGTLHEALSREMVTKGEFVIVLEGK